MTHTCALFVVVVAALCSTGSATLSVLAHQTVTSADMFDNYPAGVNLTRWDNYEWAAATQGDFEEFDVIYLGDSFSNRPSSVHDLKNTMAAAVSGRVVLSSMHYEHCGVSGTASECPPLYLALDWIGGGSGTGLLVSSQAWSTAQDWVPTVGVFKNVNYGQSDVNLDIVKIIESSHPTVTGANDSSLSNFANSAHSSFNETGAFTVVTTVCSAEAWYENAPADPTEDCTAASGTMMPNLLAYDPAAQDGVWYCRKPGVTINAFRVEHCALDCEEATFRKTRCCVASAGEKCLSTEVYPSDSSCAAAEPTCPL